MSQRVQGTGMQSQEPLDPGSVYLAGIGSALAWKHIRKSRSIWQLICESVAKRDGPTLVGFATACNAEIDTPEGELDHEAQRRLVGRLASPAQLSEISGIVRQLIRGEGWGAGELPPVLHRQALLILLRLAFQHARWDGTGTDISGPELVELALRINDHLDGLPDLPPKLRRRTRPSAADRYRGFALAFTLADISSRPRVEVGVVRNLRIMREVHPRLQSIAPNESVDVHALFQEATGLPLASYLALCFACYALTNAPKMGPGPKRSVAGTDADGVYNIGAESIRCESGISTEAAGRFLDALSLPPDVCRTELEGVGQTPETTNFTVFRRHPLARVAPGIYRVLDRAFLLDKLAGGFYWTLRVAAEARAPASDRLEAVKRFNGWWGRLFEGYVDDLFAHSPLRAQYRRQPRLDGSTSEHGDCDGLIDEGKRVVLLEYKVSPLALRPRHSLSPRQLAAEIIRKFGARRVRGTGKRRKRPLGVAQLAAATREFLEGHRFEHLDGREVEGVYPVLVCADVGMGAPMVSCLLEKRFEIRGKYGHRLRPLTVLTIEDLECMLSEDRPFSQMLDAWLEADPRMTTYPWLVIRHRFFDGRNPRNPWVAEASARWRKEMTACLWPGRTPDSEPAGE